MRKIKVGVYYDYGSHQMTRDLRKHPWIPAEIVATCHCPVDDPERVRHYETLDEMLQDDEIELISLSSPNRKMQAQEAIRCLEAGKHVYAEKPCAMTEEELDEILRVAKETGKQFHEFAGSAFGQPYYALRKLVLSGALGEIVQIHTQKSYPLGTTRPQDENVDGGLMRQVGVHNLRFIEHITGLRCASIDAVCTKIGNGDPAGELHTAYSSIMRLENGGVASAVTNYLNRNKALGRHGNEYVHVFGTKGFAEITDGGTSSRVCIGDENLGALDTSGEPKTYFEYFAENLLGLCEMPVSLEDELHPTRMVIRAAQKCAQNEQKEN